MPQAGDEEDPLTRQPFEPGVVHVAPVEDQDRPRLKVHAPRHLDLVRLAGGDDHKLWQVALMIEQQMELHRPLGALVARPVEQRSTEVDHRGVQGQQAVTKTETPGRVHPARTALIKLFENALEQLPGPVPVGIGQGGARRSVAQAQMAQFALAGRQSPADFAQGVRLPQLAKQHGDELPPASEATPVPLGPVLLHELLEFQARKKLEKLRENAAYSVHGGISFV